CRTLCPRLRRCFRRSTDPPSFASKQCQSNLRTYYLRIVHSPVSAQGRLNPSDRDYGPNVTVRIVRRAAPEPSGQGAEVEAESRNPSSRRRYCDLLQRQNRLSC